MLGVISFTSDFGHMNSLLCKVFASQHETLLEHIFLFNVNIKELEKH